MAAHQWTPTSSVCAACGITVAAVMSGPALLRNCPRLATASPPAPAPPSHSIAGHAYEAGPTTGSDYICKHCGNQVSAVHVHNAGAFAWSLCPGAPATTPGGGGVVFSSPADGEDPEFGPIQYVPPKSTKAPWRHGHCAYCYVEICPPLDGDGAEVCRRCAND